MDCIFCKIIEGELPSYKVYEDKRIIGILDINPINKGHVLVFPKEHKPNLTDLPKDLLKDMAVVMQNLAPSITEAVGATGYNIILNNGKVAGQLINHAHFHIIPRFEGDNLHHWPGKTFDDEEMKRISENIQKSI